MNLWPFALVALIIILLPVALAIGLRRRYRVPWLYFCVGVITFVVAQLVHIPLNELLERTGILLSGAETGNDLIRTAIILGLTAGLTEELVRAAGYWLIPRARRYQDGVMLGLGHGGIEAMIIGVLIAASISSLWFIQMIDALPAGATADQYASLRQQLEMASTTPLLAFAPLVERIIALTVQVSLSIIVLQAFVRRNWLYVLVAVLYHAGVDFVAVYAGQTFENPWLTEGVLAAVAFPVVVWAWSMRSRTLAVEKREPSPLSNGLKLFAGTMNKEFRFQWRTKRVLIVLAIFVVFGMVSPLLAKFTPQLISSIEGGEQLVDLLPEPSVESAFGQYIENITQFGFILAILFGMGAIAGEKDKGTAAMILSKPLPRWAFVISKFITQALLYLLAYALAGTAAYYYTSLLFEPVDAGLFLVVNVLLYLWLLVLVAVTLVGSAIGRSTGAAAGIAAILAILLLLAGSIPKYGVLTPGGLVSWARQLALGVEGAPNGGALAMALALIVVALINAVAAFEEQEL
jgi:ABC-2 type transport system permease protein